jgi:SAM-dependent methyltransferase
VVEELDQHREQVRHLFDTKAPTWSGKYAPDGPLTSRLTRLLDALITHVRPKGRVLDLGCGTGELARAAAAAGKLVTACDISPAMLRTAADLDAGSQVNWVPLDVSWRTLPFRPATFDAVVAASVLEYVDDPGLVLVECARVLQPGGTLLCTVPNTRHPIRWAEWIASFAARSSLVRAVSPRWPRLASYMIYLTLSRQRHSVSWWRVAAAQAGLLMLPHPFGANNVHSSLRLFICKRPEYAEEG